MARSSIFKTPHPPTGQVEQQVASSYDLILKVVENLELLTLLASRVDSLDRFVEFKFENMVLSSRTVTGGTSAAWQVVADLSTLNSAYSDVLDLKNSIEGIQGSVEASRDATEGFANQVQNTYVSITNLASSLETRIQGAEQDLTDWEGLLTAGMQAVEAAREAAVLARDAANTAAALAVSSAEKAEAWASNPTDTPVEGGLYSSKHYAEKAAEAAALIPASTVVGVAAGRGIAVSSADPRNPVVSTTAILPGDLADAALDVDRFYGPNPTGELILSQTIGDADSVQVFRNGLLQESGTGYTLTVPGSSMTVPALQAQDWVSVYYLKGQVVGLGGNGGSVDLTPITQRLTALETASSTTISDVADLQLGLSTAQSTLSTVAGNYIPKSGATDLGKLTFSAAVVPTNAMDLVYRGWVEQHVTNAIAGIPLSDYLLRVGGVVSGQVEYAAGVLPTQPTHLVHKAYVDDAVSSVNVSAYDVAVAAGFVGDEAAWLQSLIGAKGDTGATGATGRSAYQVAVDAGFVGTEADWLLSLKGPKGDSGQNGSDGNDGQSAYEIALSGGFVGTEAAWLASLVGPKGEPGADGTNGRGPIGDLPPAATVETTDLIELERPATSTPLRASIAQVLAMAGSGAQTGDMLLTARTPDGGWLEQGAIYAQAAYPDLYALVGLIGDAPPGRYWTEKAVSGSRTGAAAWLDNNVVLWPGANVINRSTDGGETWTAVAVTGGFTAVCWMDATTAIACGSGGKIIRTTDAGMTWTPITSGTTQNLAHIVSMTPLRAIVASDSRNVKYTSDGGMTWSNSTTTSGLFDTQSQPICRLSHSDAIIAVPGLKTTDGGVTWSPMTYPEAPTGSPPTPVAFDAETVVFLAANNDKLFRTTNAGQTWVVTDISSLNLGAGSYGAVRISPTRALVCGAGTASSGVSSLLLLDKGLTLNASTTVLSGTNRYPSISPDGNKMLMAAGSNIAKSIPEYHYDTAMLFKTPTVGDIKGYIKA